MESLTSFQGETSAQRPRCNLENGVCEMLLNFIWMFLVMDKYPLLKAPFGLELLPYFYVVFLGCLGIYVELERFEADWDFAL